MNIQAILIPLLTNLVEKILSNQFTKQNITDEVKTISATVGEHVQASSVEKDATILMLEAKLKDLVTKVDLLLDAKIDEIVKNVQDKTPFFLDGVVEKFGEEAKNQINLFSANGAQELIDFLEGKAAALGLIKATTVSASNTVLPSATVETHVDTSVSSSGAVKEDLVKDGLSFLSDKASDILQDLKDKHKGD